MSPGVALPDVVCIGDAVPVELPAVKCLASAGRLTVSAVVAQDLAGCVSSGGLASGVVVPAVVPSVGVSGSSLAVFASL